MLATLFLLFFGDKKEQPTGVVFKTICTEKLKTITYTSVRQKIGARVATEIRVLCKTQEEPT